MSPSPSILLLLATLVAAQNNLRTVYVATLSELVIAMEDPMVGRIWVNKVRTVSFLHTILVSSILQINSIHISYRLHTTVYFTCREAATHAHRQAA